MSKQTINLGSSANDGTGDPLRTAFDKVNDNFDELYLYSTVTSTNNITITANTIATDNTNGDVIVDPNGTGRLILATGSELRFTDHVDNAIAFVDAQGDVNLSANLTYNGSSALAVTGSVTATTTMQGTTITATTAFVPDASDGAALGTTALQFSDLFLADGAVIGLGDDQDVTITHVADSGITIKSAATADDKPVTITLQTGETDMAANDKLGVINFQAPNEGTGTDAILVAAGIEAISEGDFSSSANATKLSFKTAASAAAAETMALSSVGLLTLNGTGSSIIIKDGGNIGSASDTNAIGISSAGIVSITAATASSNSTTGALTVAGGAGIAADLSVGDDVRLISDAAVLSFGANSEITLTHDHDVGLKLKHSATADDKPIVLTLQTGETDMAANDVIGAIRFQAPDEATGTDAILVAAAIQAVSEGDFSASANATRLEFHTGASEAAASKMTLSSAGLLTISDDFVLKDAGTIGSASDPDAIAIGADGDVTLTQDLELQHDGATLSFGTNNDVILTHVHDTGLLLNSTMALQFNDASQFINAPSATVLDITATDEIELNATLIDVNGNLDVSGGVNAGIHTFVATDAITAVEHAGRILLLGEVGGNADVVLTLPVASGTGNVYKFIVSVTMASNTYKIQCPNAANVINGTMKNMDLDGTAQTVFSTVAASDTITLNGGTQGGAVSDTLTLIDIASNLWHVEGQMRTPAGANPATPFSAAVS